jgi:tetratricopeptide (TPR) repeat protein
MISAADTPQPSQPEICGRLAVFEYDGDQKNLIARLMVTVDEGQGSIRIDGPTDDDVKRIGSIVERLHRETTNTPTLESLRNQPWPDKWRGLVAALEKEGFATAEMPTYDHEIKIEVDLPTGRVIGVLNNVHDFAVPNQPLIRRLVASVREGFTEGTNDLASEIEAAVTANDPAQMVSTIKRGMESGAFAFRPSPRLLQALTGIDIGLFQGPERQTVREARMGVAQWLRQYEVAGEEAEALLRETPEQFDDRQKGALQMIVAMAILKKGNKEAALHTWRQLLKTPGALDAANRAWAWRNISMSLAQENPEARQTAKCSADAFLEAGDVGEAGTSLMRLVDCLLYEEPARAVEALNEIVALTDREGLRNRGLRAAAYHARANRLLQFGRHADAFRDAAEAVALWRGLIGAEEQLISSLHLAAQEARTIGRLDDAERFEGEAERLTDEIDSPHFKLARRVVALFQNFDETEAAELLRDAEREGNREVVAGVRVAQATRNPALTNTERLSLLEETLTYLDRLGARAVEKEPAQLALAEELRRIGEADRADEWYRKILASNPFSRALQIFINSLWQREKWNEAIPLLERQLRLRGRLPGFLYAYGRSLYEAGKYSEAVTALVECLKSAPADGNIAREAIKIRDAALDKGGTILLPPPPKPASHAVTREEFDEALNEFARLISSAQRKEFWRRGKQAQHSWESRPEKKAQSLLHTFLKGHFRRRVSVFDELSSGAGRIDIYLQFCGGLSLILELKMCGRGYSERYAAGGEGQLEHYMGNRDSHLGYLIVFDARTANFGAPLLSGQSQFTIFEKNIDVRPNVKTAPPQGSTGGDGEGGRT